MAVQTVKLTITPRSERGTRANRRLRRTGLVPGIIYGHKKDVIPVSLDRRELSHHLALGAHVFELSMEGMAETVLVKDVQYDHVGSDVIHVDFNRVRTDERVQVTVPLELKGTPKGEADGGVLHQNLAEIEIECLVLEIPDAIRHNVADMALDDVLHIKDLKLPPGVACLQDEDLIVAAVREVKEEEAPVAVAEEGAAEPEVIGRKAAEEEAGEEGAAPEKAEKKEK